MTSREKGIWNTHVKNGINVIAPRLSYTTLLKKQNKDRILHHQELPENSVWGHRAIRYCIIIIKAIISTNMSLVFTANPSQNPCRDIPFPFSSTFGCGIPTQIIMCIRSNKDPRD